MSEAYVMWRNERIALPEEMPDELTAILIKLRRQNMQADLGDLFDVLQAALGEETVVRLIESDLHPYEALAMVGQICAYYEEKLIAEGEATLYDPLLDGFDDMPVDDFPGGQERLERLAQELISDEPRPDKPRRGKPCPYCGQMHRVQTEAWRYPDGAREPMVRWARCATTGNWHMVMSEADMLPELGD